VLKEIAMRSFRHMSSHRWQRYAVGVLVLTLAVTLADIPPLEHRRGAAAPAPRVDPHRVPVLSSGRAPDRMPASLALVQAAASPAKTRGARATYADALADVDLVYEVTADSVKETILLKRVPAAGRAAWQFRLDTRGRRVVW
jgi:hypothetical protein